MTKWKMTNADFRYLLEEKQDFKCFLTGWDLTPATTMITHKMPLPRGKHTLANTALVHRNIVQLTRELSEAEIIDLAAAVIKARGREYGLEIQRTR